MTMALAYPHAEKIEAETRGWRGHRAPLPLCHAATEAIEEEPIE
jgi:hypothetical protein